MAGGYEFGSGFVTVMPSARGFGRDLENELDGPFRRAGQRGGDQISDGVNQNGRTGFAAAGKNLGGIFAGAFALIGGAQIVSAVTDYIKESIDLASDLSETINKSSAIFGDNAADIQAWAKTASKSVGLSQSAALDATASFGDMFLQLGFAGDTAAAMSKDVVTLSADLGSFNNLGTDEVADKISSAFRGEYDSLQALIPTINGTRVEQEALAATGKTLAAELTNGEKAAAVLAIVHADSARAAGDFAKTSDGLANSQKILKADLENVQAEIGTALLPVATELFRVFAETGVPILQDLAKWFTENQEAVSDMVLGVVDGGLLMIDTFLMLMEHQSKLMEFWFMVGDNMVSTWFAVVGSVLDGAEKMFGWVPGVGDKIREVNAGFEGARETAETQFSAIREAADMSTKSFEDGREAVDSLRTTIKSIDGMISNATINIDTYERVTAGNGSVKARAMGGPVNAGETYWVGEREAELFVPEVNGRIYNQNQLASLAGSPAAGGGGDVFNVYETVDAAATSLAISRRQSMLGRA